MNDDLRVDTNIGNNIDNNIAIIINNMNNMNNMLEMIYELVKNDSRIIEAQSKIKTSYKCAYCDNIYTTKQNMKRHEQKCDSKMNMNIKINTNVLNQVKNLHKTIVKNGFT